MVENSRAPARPGAVRALGLPQPIEVRVDEQGRSMVMRVGRRWLAVEVLDHWRIDDEWWRPAPISRAYAAVLLADGRRLTIFQDLLAGTWFRQSQ